MSQKKVNVAILDDHQSVIDGYLYRLQNVPEIHVVVTASYGNELEEALQKQTVNVLLLDVSVPMSLDDPTPAPTLHFIAKLLREHQGLAILPISMHTERSLIKAAVGAGASGYVLKDDQSTLRKLDQVILSIANGGMYFSKQAHHILMREPIAAQPILTTRQIEVLSLFAAYPHMTSAEAARKLNVADSTIRNLLSDAYVRLDVPNRSSAVIKAQHLNLLPTVMSKFKDMSHLVDETNQDQNSE